MKNLTDKFISFGIIFLFFISCNDGISNNPTETIQERSSEVEVGQIWTRIDSSNPFKPVIYDTIIVIETKGDYSRVIWNGDTTSMESELVKWRGEKLLNTQN